MKCSTKLIRTELSLFSQYGLLCTLKPHTSRYGGHYCHSLGSNWNYIRITECRYPFLFSGRLLGWATWHTVFTFTPFHLTRILSSMETKWPTSGRHLPGLSSIIEPCCHAAVTKVCKQVCLLFSIYLVKLIFCTLIYGYI